jgi:fructokinase
LESADIIKISDADLEYLYGISLTTALLNPCSVSWLGPQLVNSTCTSGPASYGEVDGFCHKYALVKPTS